MTTPKIFKADLHCHTTCSDSTVSPEEIIVLAQNSGLSGISITDHDSIDAYESATPLANKLGIELITGVEFSAKQKECSVHILAYCFAIDNPTIVEFCQRHKERRVKRMELFLKRLTEQGMPITEDELLNANHLIKGGKQNICRPHIAVAMIQKGYVKTLKEAFKNYLSEGKSCYVSSEYPTVQETIDTIHKGGGIAILAHPHLINRTRILREVLKMNFDGLEAYYGRFAKPLADKWIAIAKEKNWLVTGCSDFHGSIKPDFQLGCSWVDETLFRKLQSFNI